MVALVLLSYAQFRMWADEYHGRNEDKRKSADASAGFRIEMESKERDWGVERNHLEESRRSLQAEISTLRTQLHSKRHKPNVVLEFMGGLFILENRGDDDATNVQVGRLTCKGRYLEWDHIDRIKHGHSVDLDVSTCSVGVGESLDLLHVNAISQDRGPHISAMEWLVTQPNSLNPSVEWFTEPFEGDIEITFNGDEGRTNHRTYFIIRLDVMRRDISILPKPPEQLSGPSTPPSRESTTHAD